uniref:Glutamate decarboxylase 1b n=1 Tax=Sinocyclocheilus grahami TaxID=75366 RepID=A0A672T9R9_SINGR
RLLSKTLKREKDLSFTSISTKVLDFHHPHQLLEGMEGFNLELCDQPESLEQILVDCRDTLKYGVRTGHPRFFNQLSSGLDIIGLAGEWLTSTANTNIYYTILRLKVKIKGMAAAPRLVLFTSERVGHLLSVAMLFPESLLYKEGQCSAGFRHRESDLAENR